MQTSEPSAQPPADPSAPTPGQSRKSKRRLGCMLALVLGLVGVGSAPYWGAPWLRGQVARAVAKPFAGTAHLQRLQVGWGGGASVHGLELEDATGRPMLSIDSLDLKVQPLGLLRGHLRAKAALQNFTVYLEQDAQGRWNWQPAADDTQARESEPVEGKSLDPSADVQFDLSWSDGQVILRGPGGEQRLVRFAGRAHWPGGDQPGTLEARCSTPDSAEPVLRWQATLQPVRELSPDLQLRQLSEQLAGQWTLELQSLSTDVLQALRPAHGSPQPEGAVSGRLEGQARPASEEFEGQAGPASHWNLSGALDFVGRWPIPMAEDEKDPAPLSSPAVRWIEQSAQLEVAINALLAPDFDRAQVNIERCSYRSPTATWQCEGDVRIGAQLEDLSAQIQGHLETPLERLLVDLAPLIGWHSGQAAGQLRSSFTLQGEGGRLRSEGDISVHDFRLQAQVDEERSLEFADPETGLEWKFSFDPQARAASIERLAWQSETLWGSLRGRVLVPQPEGSASKTASQTDPAMASVVDRLVLDGVHGQWSYHPDRLGALLQPWLPGTLSGSEPRPVELELEGRVGDLDWQGLLQGLQGKAVVELGQYADFGLATSGQLVLENLGQRIQATGALQANGGRASLDSSIPLQGSAESPATLRFAVEGIRTNPELSTLLGWIHPALGALDAQRTGDLTGLVSASLDLRYAGPLQDTWLQGDFADLDWGLVSGRGTLAIDEASLAGSPLLVELLGWLGRPASTPIRWQPLEFAIQAGRLHYDHPWDWTVEGERTQFQGSVGLDRSLDLRWTVPISAALARKHKVLQPLVGQNLVVPITGSIERPRVDLAGVLRDLAQRSLQEGLKDQLEKEIGKRIGLPSSGSQDPSGSDPSSRDPESLLQEADRLYAAGDKQAARALYQRLRQEHKTSLVYLLHRSRIKRRAQE